MKQILLNLAHMGGDERRYIDEAFQSQWVAPLGPNVDAFEAGLEAELDGRGAPAPTHVAALSSGTAALHLALVMLGIRQGDEVLCQTFSFAASANPILYQGATPVFVDSEPQTWNISPALLEEAILARKRRTGRTPRALIATDIYGMPARWPEILDICRRHGVAVVEDAAEALGSTLGGQPCGTFGLYGALSFNGNKIITCSTGGALLCPDARAKALAVCYATQSRELRPWYEHTRTGYNYRLSNVCAGIGRGQLHVLQQHLDHRRRLHQLYADLLGPIAGLRLHREPTPECRSNHWLNAVILDEAAAPYSLPSTPYALLTSLAAQGIETRLLWKPLHTQPVFAGAPAYTDGTAERLFRTGLALPSGACVTEDDARTVVRALRQALRQG